MLARIALDCSAFTPVENGPTGAQLRSLHQELIETLLRHGIVIDVSEDEFRTMVEQLPSGAKSLWVRASKKLRRQTTALPSRCLCQIDDEKTLETWWKKRADIAILEPARAELLGVPASAITLRNPRVEMELVRFGFLRDAETLVELRALSVKRIHRGDDRQRMWKERFEPLMKHADHVVVCDRFAGSNLVRYGANTGLSWFLERIYAQRKARKGGKPYVQLIVGVVGDHEGRAVEEMNRKAIRDAVRRLTTTLAPGRADLAIRLLVVPDFVFQQEAHDRHIRFDHQVFEIGVGVDVFRAPTVVNASTCIYLGEESANEDAAIEQVLEGEAYILRGWGVEEL